jgi:hypothetical protein
MSKNRSMTVLVVVFALAVVLTGGLMASNMGFKLNRALIAGADPGSASGTQLIALPYNRQVGIDTAEDLFKDIGTSKVQNIQRYNTANDKFVPYAFGLPNFPLVAGQGVSVKMGTNTNYIVVGSHDPSAVIQLESAGAASASGTQLYAPPYHGTAAMASQLFIELGPTNVQNIQRYNTANDKFQPYGYGLPDFPINPGEAYFVKMGNTLAYSPSHY